MVVIGIKTILSVVAMIPFPFLVGGRSEMYFTIERMGLDVIDTEDNGDDD